MIDIFIVKMGLYAGLAAILGFVVYQKLKKRREEQG